jgi:integrase/recombinase XerD
MPKPAIAPCFAMLVQRFFTEHLTHHRAVSPRTVTAYGDTFHLLLQFAERHIGKPPASLNLVDLDTKLMLAFLDHLERDRKNGARSRNARLAALRSFLK